MITRIIEDEILKRKLNLMVHFTNTENLENICKYGLLTRKELNDLDIEYEYNDQFRIDDLEDSISLSITFPNYKMFYSLRCNDRKKRWAVIELDLWSVLQLNCLYCFTNAASNEERYISLEDRKTDESFCFMFSEIEGRNTRDEMNLFDNETTNPQAEVLVLESIPVEYITRIVFDSQETLKEYKDILDNCDIYGEVDSSLFAPRHDYE